MSFVSFPELSPHSAPHFVGVYTHAYFVEDSLDVFQIYAKLYRHSLHLFKIYHNKASNLLCNVLGVVKVYETVLASFPQNVTQKEKR